MNHIEEGGERRDIIVTSSGLLFVDCNGGKVCTFAAGAGKSLWSYQLPADTGAFQQWMR